MSADNHVECPRCKKRGNTPDPSNPLREYIDVGMGEDGVFLVDYRCEWSFE